jgi:hypothetical protein
MEVNLMSWLPFGKKELSMTQLAEQILLFEKSETQLKAQHADAYQRGLDLYKRELTGKSVDPDAIQANRNTVLDLESKLKAIIQLQSDAKDLLQEKLEEDRLQTVQNVNAQITDIENRIILSKRHFLSALAAAVIAQEAYLGLIDRQSLEDGRFPSIWNLLDDEKCFFFSEIQRFGSAANPANLFFTLDELRKKKADIEATQITSDDLDAFLRQKRSV